MERFEVTIAGAGVIGLAIAYTLARSNRFDAARILLVEQESRIGQHISSRHSEVIHGGIYYAPESLKAHCCVRGNALLYEFCDTYDVAYNKIGKLIISNDKDLADLEYLTANAKANGVFDLEPWDKRRLQQEEPALRAIHALLSPSTGIIDSHEYMERLLQLARDKGLVFAPNTRIKSAKATGEGIEIISNIAEGSTPYGDDNEYQFQSDLFINATGLGAQQLAHRSGITKEHIPTLYPCKGDYFSYSGRNPFNHLIYPMPEPNLRGLGIHSTQDLAGQLRFGPDSHYVDVMNFDVDANKAADYADAIRRYFPAIEQTRLQPAYAGIRPKLAASGEPPADFEISGPEQHGQDGMYHLYGIESPGLTSSLALAEVILDAL